MNRHLDGKVALVTGASSGIGRATAIVFAREGAKLVLDDIDVAGGEETVKLVKEAGGEAIFVRADVMNSTDVAALVSKAVESYGRLDCAFNNAGISGVTATTTECPEENWDHVIDVNLKGVWLCMKYEIPQMLKQGGGAIVNTSSIAGLIGVQGRPAYIASKHGVAGLTKAAALEYGKDKIRVNAVCPGVIRTAIMDRLFTEMPQLEETRVAQHPIGRLGFPEEVAEAVVWLCSDAASFVTGLIMTVDGGFTAQ